MDALNYEQFTFCLFSSYLQVMSVGISRKCRLFNKKDTVIMKKKRAANFTSEEKDKLLTAVLKYKNVLFERVTIGNDTPQKHIAWSHIFIAVNSVSFVHRTLQDIRRKLKDLKAATRRKYMTTDGRWRESLSVNDTSPEEQKILALLGNVEAIRKVDILPEVPEIKEDLINSTNDLDETKIKEEETGIPSSESFGSLKRHLSEDHEFFSPESEDRKTNVTSASLLLETNHLTPLISKYPIKKIKLFMQKNEIEDLNEINPGENPETPVPSPLSVTVGVQTDETNSLQEVIRTIANSLKSTALGLEKLAEVL